MPLVSLELPAGVYRNGTKLQSKGRWYDANMVRWRNGRLRPIGGWLKTTASVLAEVGRSMFAWRDNSLNKLLAIGTAEKLYIYSSTSGTPYDATPSNFSVGRTTALAGLGVGAGPYNGTTVNKTVTATDISIGSSTTIVSSSTHFAIPIGRGNGSGSFQFTPTQTIAANSYYIKSTGNFSLVIS